jgi:hypothetical protein
MKKSHKRFDFNRGQFDKLREEILFRLKEVSQTKVVAGLAAAVACAWLAKHPIAPFRWCWFLLAAFPLLGALRARAVGRKINLIGAYIRWLESQHTDDKTPGWETAIWPLANSRPKPTVPAQNEENWWKSANPVSYSGVDWIDWLFWSIFFLAAIMVGFSGFFSLGK